MPNRPRCARADRSKAAVGGVYATGLTPQEVAAVEKGRPVAKVLSWGEPSDIGVVAIKQLYASHYFHTALDLTVCVADSSAPGGFYLPTLKGSEQEGLTGIRGSMLRQVAVAKIRGSLERALASIKRTIEQSASAAER